MKKKPVGITVVFVCVSIFLSWLFSALKPLFLPVGSDTIITVLSLLPDMLFWLACYFFWGFRDFGLRFRQDNPGILLRYLCLWVIPFYTILLSLIFTFDPSYSNVTFPPVGNTIDIFSGKFFAILLIPVLWEELTFRGILQGYLQKVWSTPVLLKSGKQSFFLDYPVLLSSFAFSLIHLSLLLNGEMDRDLLTLLLQILFFYPLIGFILGKIRRISGSIVLPILIHAAYNTTVNFPNFFRQ